MPVLLLIDTCGATGYVAVVDADQPVPPLAARTLPGRETQELLLSTITSVLAETGKTLAGFAAIAVVAGPGSFTGVRIGLAAAKGLAEAGNLPLIALSRLAVLAVASGETGKVKAWMDAGRTDLYVGTFDLQPNDLPINLGEAMLPRAAALQTLEGATLVVEDSAIGPDAGDARCVTVEAIQHATACLAAMALHAKSFADVALLDANYLRVPDAETALRARQAASA